MTTEQHDSKAERIAELDGVVAHCTDMRDALSSRGHTEDSGDWQENENRLGKALAELSRLRNEGGDSKTEEGRGGPWQCPACSCRAYMRISKSDTVRCFSCKRIWPSPSPLAPVEAGRGEREALERVVDETLADIVRNGTAVDAETANEIGSMLKPRICAALSQGNGGEAVGWQLVPKEPTDAMLEAAVSRDTLESYFKSLPEDHPYREKGWANGAKAGQKVKAQIRYNAMLAVAPAPSSPHEGVREALELLQRWLHQADTGFWRDRTNLGLNAHPLADETRNFLTTTPSRGLVDAADRKALQSLHWHLINRTENREVLLDIVEAALGFRIPSAKGTATADGGRDA